MITEKHFTRVGIVALSIGLGALGYKQMGAHADGIPGMSPMTYAGLLEEASGPVTGPRNLRLTIYDIAAGGDSTNIRCVTNAPGTSVTNGRFQVALDNTCTAAVRGTPDLWLEVEVGGTSIGRTKMSAVPFAVEAGRSAGLTPAASNALVPSGTVVAFAGTFARVPSGWLPCDGRSVARTAFPALFDAIGTAHGGDGTNFNLPDYRGRFLRGVDNGVGRDPDRAMRASAASGGNAGDAVGSTEDESMSSHTHGLTLMQVLFAAGAVERYVATIAASTGCVSGGSSCGQRVGTGNETRPVNAAVNYIIKL
jgi:microcystin-dependent protein